MAVNEPRGFKVANPPWSPPELAARLPPIPSSDLYSLGRVMIWLLGGDPATHVMPPSVDERLGRFLLFFVRESARQRAQDAWEMYGKLGLLRKELYGPHQFTEFSL
jgi:serine/threonine protein kinase